MKADFTWSTQDVDPSQIQAYWSKALDEIMPGLRYNAVSGPFEARLRKRSIGKFALNYVQASPQRIVTPATPRTSTAGQFGLIYLKKGLLKVQHCARTIEVGPGECIILDALEASEVVTCRESESLNLSLPAGWLKQWLVRPESEVAKPFIRSSPLARPLLELLDLLSLEETPLPNSDMLMLNQLGGAFALAVGDSEIVGTNHAARLLIRLKQGICVRFFDPGYSLQLAADEAGISRRYLVSLFAQAGTTFNTELMRIRIERSAEMLRDPRFETLSVMDISLRCGFSDASHFSKRFRAQYDASPAAYRQAEHDKRRSILVAAALH